MNHIKHIIFLLIVTIGMVHGSFAQRQNPIRVELNANLDMEDYNLVPCRESGILVFFESEKKGNRPDTRIWHFAFYDKNMKQQWLADTALITGVKFKGYSHDKEHTWLIFLDSDRQKSEYNLQLLRLEYDVNIFEVINVSAPEKSEPVHFSIHNHRAVIAFNNSRFEPWLQIINLQNASASKLQFDLEGLNIIQEVRWDPMADRYHLIVDNYLDKRQNAIIILQTDRNGALEKKQTINTALEKKVINEARIAMIKGDTLIIMGTYSNFATRVGDKQDESGSETAGYFICRFEGEKEVFINYYNFLEFEEMYRALSSKTIADLRRKAERQKSKGEEYSLDYTLLLHDVVPFGDNFVLLSEAYYPEYRTVTNMYYDYYGRPIPQTYTVFDGYNYISGIAAAFTPDGKMVWDDGIEIRDILTFNLSRYMESYVSGNELAIFYSSQNKLYYKMAGSAESGNSLQNISIETKYKGDKVMEDLGSKMVHWYDNYFICYGYQQIRNNRISGGKRTVFFFNKLAFQ